MGKVTARHATQPREQNRLEQGNSRCASTFTGFVASVPSCKNAQIGESEEEDDLCAGHLRSQPPCTTLNITAIGGQAVLSYLAGNGPVNTATSTVFHALRLIKHPASIPFRERQHHADRFRQ